MNKYSTYFYKIFLILFFIIFFLLLLVIRYIFMRVGLPDYSLADPASGIFAMKYLLGDLNPNWYQHGPLFSYLLFSFYSVFLFFSSYDMKEFVEDYFFNPYNYYLVARIFSTTVIVLLAFITSYVSARLYDKKVAVFVLILAIFPFIDNLVLYYPKIDLLQAIWVLLTVYSAIKISQTGKLEYYMISGLLIALSFVTKPLTSLLILPTVFLSHYLVKADYSGIKKNINIFFNKKLLFLIISSIFFVFVFNPYLLFHLKDFIQSHIDILYRDPFLSMPKGINYLSILSDNQFLGIIFIALSVVSIVYFLYKYKKTKDPSFLIILSYPIFFFLAFLFFPCDPHFFIPIIPLLFIMISKFIIDVSQKINNLFFQYVFITVVFLLIIAQPSIYLYKKSIFSFKNQYPYNSVTTLVAKDWIEDNIPPMSKIFMNELYARLPRLMNYDIKKHMEYDEAFAYGHDRNELYVERFKEIYEKYKNEGGIFYDIESSRNNTKTKWEELGLGEEHLFNYCIKNDFDYVIAIRGDLEKYSEFNDKLFFSFTHDKYPIGREINIYKLK